MALSLNTGIKMNSNTNMNIFFFVGKNDLNIESNINER